MDEKAILAKPLDPDENPEMAMIKLALLLKGILELNEKLAELEKDVMQP